MSSADLVLSALQQWHRSGRPRISPGLAVHPDATIERKTVLCPSHPEEGATGVIGIVRSHNTEWTTTVVPLTDPELDAIDGTLRAAGPCRRSACAFWRESCQLGAVVASTTSDPTSTLPPCPIRTQCRWHLEQGPAACRSCDGLFRVMTRPARAAAVGSPLGAV